MSKIEKKLIELIEDIVILKNIWLYFLSTYSRKYIITFVVINNITLRGCQSLTIKFMKREIPTCKKWILVFKWKVHAIISERILINLYYNYQIIVIQLHCSSSKYVNKFTLVEIRTFSESLRIRLWLQKSMTWNHILWNDKALFPFLIQLFFIV